MSPFEREKLSAKYSTKSKARFPERLFARYTSSLGVKTKLEILKISLLGLFGK
jgi:hypothetical protein